MEYEELVAAIAHIDAALNLMGLNCPDNVTDDTYQALYEARNEMTRTRLELLGNGQERPFVVADLELTETLALPAPESE